MTTTRQKPLLNSSSIRNLCVRLTLLILSGAVSMATIAQQSQQSQELFNQYEFSTGTTNQQTVLTGDYLGSETAELAITSIDDLGRRHLQLYGFDGRNWGQLLDTTLRNDVLFIDTINIDGRDRLLTWAPGRLYWFDAESSTEHLLLEVPMEFQSTCELFLPHVDITRDVNQDGLDDLVMPGVDGFWISLQSNDGSFNNLMLLGPPEPFQDASTFDDDRRYSEVGINAQTVPAYLSRVHEVDFNRDGRGDLVFWNEDHFDVHFQDGRGQFSPQPERFTTDVAFTADGAYSFNFAFSDENMFRLITGMKARTKRTALHSFLDMNGDGVADLLTQSIEGRSLLNQRGAYAVHFGTPTGNGLSFATDPSVLLEPHANAKGGAPLGYSLGWLEDFDGDGQTDIGFGRANTGVFGFFSAILLNSISVEIEYYRIVDGVYPDTPNGSLRVRSDREFIIGGRGPFFPTILLGDINGDSRADLLVGVHWDELQVYLGSEGSELLSPLPQKLTVAMTANGEQDARLVDLNNDRKEDLIIHHPNTEPQKLVVLIAR